MKITIVTVLYNQELTAGSCWKTLLEPALEKAVPECEAAGKPGIQVIAADNSTDPEILEKNRRTTRDRDIVYLDMQGNKGLPAAYNRAIFTACGKDRAADSWIVLADQDTSFPADYLPVLIRETESTDASVLFPEVRAGEKQLSPCRKKGDRFVPYSPGNGRGENGETAFFINTGLALNLELFAGYGIRYDERIFLDFADFDLICQIRSSTDAAFRQMPGIVLQQAFSGTEARTPEQDLERFRHFMQDGRVFYGKWYGEKAAAAAIRSRALRLAAKHRDIRFLKKA